MKNRINILDLQMKISNNMQAEGWACKTDDERLQEARRRLRAAICQIYHINDQGDLPPDQRTTCTGQQHLPGI